MDGINIPIQKCIKLFLIFYFLTKVQNVNAELTPPYFNLAEGRKITASSTCGVDIDEPELYCKLVGANTENEQYHHFSVIQGQVCDYCDPTRLDKAHPAQYAIDGTENWWQSPPLSRGSKYNEVNLTIDFGQEFHVAYLFIRMGNSPRPGLWTLEKSTDYGKTWKSWQHFSDQPNDCIQHFGIESLRPIANDDDVICTTEYSKIVPLEGGEIPVMLLNNRPSANNYFNSTTLQEWTRATNVRIRLLRTKNLLGHLMSVARQDPTVTRRYFYSIKDISIGGRCMCNGHASTCNVLDPRSPTRILACQCQHNTCGIQCEKCCPGFEQKKWSQNTNARPFSCEPCNCHGHSDKCEYSEEIDDEGKSLDIHGNYEGGGVCQDCQDNTEGINCNKCKNTYFRPEGKYWNETDVCQPCNCNYFYSTGNCAEETGQCECRSNYSPPNCDSCSYGHFGFPDCRPCECNLNGTYGYHCEAVDGKCPCKPNFDGVHCKQCSPAYYNYPECEPCDCNPIGSNSDGCNDESGQCSCKINFAGQHCDQCKNGYYDYPTCTYCNCDIHGTFEEVCDKRSGQCLCRDGYGGARCDQCLPGYYNYPECVPCNCSSAGSVSTVCDVTGRCSCLSNFGGRQCTSCLAGYYDYPECLPCNCDSHGTIGLTCNKEGQCQCAYNFDGKTCNQCKEGFYNFPACEECNCDPAGVVQKFGGCGSVPAGELCQCKERVQGRICDKCRPLYWNLNASNPHGCEDCDCSIDGTLGALDTCDTKTGQCACKPSVTGRECGECEDGTFDLYGGSLFGCKDCGCDIGGSADNVCNKETGQCRCHPRISGRTCTYPLTTHYYPTLYQFQYEYEDGYTPSQSNIRYQYHEDVFPNFSKKGYAVMSYFQKEIINQVQILKSAVNRLVIRYKNPTQENIIASILIQSDNPNEVDQTAKVLFKPGTEPQFVTVSGAKGEIPSPIVLDPGVYSISIKTDKSLFLDYFVLLPAAYYEAGILTRNIETPCDINENGNELCRNYKYPSISEYKPVFNAFVTEGDESFKASEYFNDFEHLNAIKEDNLPVFSETQTQLNYALDVPHSGRYVIVVDYITHRSHRESTVIRVNQADEADQDGAFFALPCTYTTVCRQPVIDRESREKVFFIDVNHPKPIEVATDDPGNVAIKSVTAIPYEEWSIDYIRPQPVCVIEKGKCITSSYRSVPDSKKIEFEFENEDKLDASLPPPADVFDNNTKLIYLHRQEPAIEVNTKIPQPGRYYIIVQYYQPNHPSFNIFYRIETDRQNYDGKFPVNHCPSNAGCRTVLEQENGFLWFDLDDYFTFTLNNGQSKGAWLDYVLLIPAEQFNRDLLQEETYDQTKQFIHECGQDHFHMDVNNTSEFCKQAVFSLTADYNSGALPCGCDYYGSTSFECEQFGGKCTCKPYVIGRQCDACKTGYYGFPDCKPCDCPQTALCQKDTGECICPDRVTGEKCDKCIPYTFGFDAVAGCEECNCNPLGVERGDLQCDLNNGSCTCKSNVIGRTCDRCEYGFYNFPHCEPCRCDIRGTTFEICDQEDERCLCKKNVVGRECNHCMDGTYNLQASNAEGCTKCFCFGHTTRCESAYLRPFNVSMMKDVTLNTIKFSSGKSEIIPWAVQGDILINDTTAEVQLIEVDNDVLLSGLIYFGMLDYLLNLNSHISAYGGYLTYRLYYTNNIFGNALIGPDIILEGKNLELVHQSYEQPASKVIFQNSVQMIETNFQTASGAPVTREQFMMVLRDLKAIYIRASYWENGIVTRVSDVSLTMADDDTENYDLYEELPVERCECPPGYIGLSCEDCAPGYYRDPDGPYGGYCIPCNCHGHAETCDCNTGICNECKHSTEGEHCEKCIEGYYGNATYGSPNDCMICACPLPVESNNFANSCEVSEDGYHVHCQCKEGYAGATCQSCATGYFGEPQIEGEVCKPCECSGNINPDQPGSCDSVSGECLLCLNNTSGEACNLCAPGFYGDAIQLKNCQSCICDSTGTEHCDNFIGTCNCYENVIGEKCDRCDDDHYGFESGRGCTACDCGIASNSTQCHDHSGDCACKPGVTGKKCDRCLPGYWNYTGDGCQTCSCNVDYSRGFGCNPLTGQCECLSGVVGEKCDSCPYRWVLIPDTGCEECDGCHHALLDVTDELKTSLDPVLSDLQTIADDYYTSQKLKYYDDLVDEIEPKVRKLDPNGVNLTPSRVEIESLENDLKNLNRQIEYAEQNSKDIQVDSDSLLRNASNILDNCRFVNKNTKNTIREVIRLADNLDKAGSTKLDTSYSEAEDLLEQIKKYNVSPDNLNEQLENANQLLKSVEEYKKPVDEQNKKLNKLIYNIGEFDVKLEDLYNWSQESEKKNAEASKLLEKNKRATKSLQFDTVTKQKLEAQKNLNTSKEALDKAGNILLDIYSNHKIADNKNVELGQLNTEVQKLIPKNNEDLKQLDDLINQAIEHAGNLKDQARNLTNENLNVNEEETAKALQAATAYTQIADAVTEAENAVDDARHFAKNATDLTEGIEERAGSSDQISRQLLDDGVRALNLLQSDLEPHINRSADIVNKIIKTNENSDEQLIVINNALDMIPETSHTDTWTKAKQQAEDSYTESKDTLKKLDPIIDELPKSLDLARQLPKEIDTTNKDIAQVSNQIERFKQLIPNIEQLVSNLDKKQSEVDSIQSDIGDRIEKIKEQIQSARDLANGIKAGVTFYPNTTLELKPPEALSLLATNSRISTYFKTDKQNGFLMYLGNENKDDRKPSRNDYMALEIENGYPVLFIDLGNGPEKIINNKFVSNDKWHQLIVDRTGNNVKLIVREELDDGTEALHEALQIIPGSFSVFNVDKDSKLFVGGYPPDFNAPSEIQSHSFEGDIEELKIGDNDVGLWNFVDAQNNYEAAEPRNKLLSKDKPATGFRFGGNGYVILDSKPYSFKQRSSIQFKFKAHRDTQDGLLFYAGKKNHFISIELKNSAVVFQFKLGQHANTVRFDSQEQFNDDNWHEVLAERDGGQGRLKVDDKVVLQEESFGRDNQPDETLLKISDTMYFGGFPGKINHTEVTNKHFDGCIDDVYISGTKVDLSLNLRAYDVRLGCPVKFSPLVSFAPYPPRQYGYLRQPNVSSSNNLQVNLKFKTKQDKGILFYATNNDQSATFGLTLEEGVLVLRSSKDELNTGSNRYNNGEWHVVTATHDHNRLSLSIDDDDEYVSHKIPTPLYIPHGDIYFGGLPKGFVTPRGAISNEAYFVGCISDVTVNGQIVNFANLTDRSRTAQLDNCAKDLLEYDVASVPIYYPDGTEEEVSSRLGQDVDDKLNEIDEDVEKDTKHKEEAHKPLPPPLIDEADKEKDDEAEEEEGKDDRLSQPESPKADTSTIPPTTITTPTTTRRPRPTPPEKIDPICKLPVVPDQDEDFNIGYRFGTGQNSRIEFHNIPHKTKKQYELSLSFKAESSNGILFYAADSRHTDFIAVYLRNGYIYHSFNCGSGSANMSSSKTYDDNEWHTVQFSRQQTKGRLVIDSEDETEGESVGNTRTMSVQAPFFVGGFDPQHLEDIAINLKIDKNTLDKEYFVGCVNDVQMSNRPIGEPTNIVETIPCSKEVEGGIFFGKGGGYIKLRDRYKIGTEFTISLDIKPRTNTGLLLSVHGKKAFFILQLINGTIIFSVDNGDGPIVAEFKPEEENFCDGQWRTVTAIKSKYVISLQVNEKTSHPAVGDARNPSTDTTRPFFLGGHPHLNRIRGITARQPYQGCIRNVKIKDVPEPITPKMSIGNVQTGVCPLN
uniref:Putative response to misfolded protein n=1 Tax=Corethrella appendiculata TaxID=1370023 RepID=W4VRR7_9DIPT